MKQKHKVAFIGAGTMGKEMVLNLLKAGYEVTVYNRTTDKAKFLIDAGAKQKATPAAAARDADFIISMVSDDTASREIWIGPNGVLLGKPKSNAIAIESSTLSYGWTLKLCEILNKSGLRFIDCPVTGGPDGAREGTLTLLVGAEKEALDKARPLLSAYSRRIIHFGQPGFGMAYKLIVNLIGAVQAVALAEGWLVAERAGLDLGKVKDALSTGAVASPHVKYLVERMFEDNHDDIYFKTRWRHKDAAYGLKLGMEMGQYMPTSTAAEKVFKKAVSIGFGDKNSSIIIDVLRRERIRKNRIFQKIKEYERVSEK